MDQRRQQFAAKRVVETGGDDADKILLPVIIVRAMIFT